MTFAEPCDGGAHATTRLAAAALLAVMRRGDRVLDAGFGDGFLARLARDAGARVTALDIDPAAVGMSLPGVEGIRGDAAQIDRTFDVVVANLPDAELRRCLPSLVAAAGRVLVVTGGRLVQASAIRRALAGLVATASSLDGWYCLSVVRGRASFAAA